MDLADATYKWRCPKCGELYEESDTGMCDVRRITHQCKELVYARPIKKLAVTQKAKL